MHSSLYLIEKLSQQSRPVVAKVEWHPGELYPRVGFRQTLSSHLNLTPDNAQSV
jgi:hypothetical protein